MVKKPGSLDSLGSLPKIRTPDQPEESKTEATENMPSRKRQTSRINTVLIGGHYDHEVLLLVKECAIKLSRERKERVSQQNILQEAIKEFLQKNGFKTKNLL